jgi:hypothetical protein
VLEIVKPNARGEEEEGERMLLGPPNSRLGTHVEPQNYAQGRRWVRRGRTPIPNFKVFGLCLCPSSEITGNL